MATKELVFTAIFLIGSAGLVTAVAAIPLLRRILLCLFFAGVVHVVDVNYVSREDYRGWVRGFEVGTLDMLWIGLLAAVVLGARRRPVRPYPAVFPAILLYLAVAVSASLVAMVPLYAGFGLFKMARDALVFWVIANATRDEEDLTWLIATSVGVVLFEGAVAAKGYLGGVYRARGTFDHPNTLGMFINMHLPIVLSYLLNARHRLTVPLVAVFGLGAGTVVLTLSRGSWVTMFVSVALVVGVSLLLRTGSRKFAILGLMALLAVPAGGVVVRKMVQRVKDAPVASGEARHTFNRSALQMARDRPLGVGVNNYSHATAATPYAEPYAGGLDQGGLCHNAYFLTLGETGWPGLIAYLAVTASAYWVMARFLLTRLREDLRSVWMVGWLGGMTTLVLQSTLEWAVRQTVLSFTFFGLLGVMAAVAGMRPGRSVARWRVTVRYAAAPTTG